MRMTIGLGILTGLAFVGEPASATTTTQTFQVQLTIQAQCVINSTATLNFGTLGVLGGAGGSTNNDQTTTVAVQCTNTTPYDIGLDAGTTTGGSTTTRLLVGTRLERDRPVQALYGFGPHDELGQYGRYRHVEQDRQRRIADLDDLRPHSAADHAHARHLFGHRDGHGHLLMRGAAAMSIKSCLVRASLTALFASPCAMPQAASLQVAPVLVEVPAPGATATLKLRNEGNRPLDAQIRIFKWTQVDGADSLTPTNDVAASPPLASLRPNTDYTVRVVRTKKEPVAKEESYRLLIDELPSAAGSQGTAVNIALRYSMPVFFTVPGNASKIELGTTTARQQTGRSR